MYDNSYWQGVPLRQFTIILLKTKQHTFCGQSNDYTKTNIIYARN